MQFSYRPLNLLGALVLTLLLSACSQAPVKDVIGSSDSHQVGLALSGAPLGYTSPPADIPLADTVLQLTPAMEAFAERAVRGLRRDSQKVEALHQALLAHEIAGGLGVTYSATATLTAQEVFRQRQANCLSFSLLFVSLARHVGLQAAVNDVAIPPTWGSNQGRVQFIRHVNARVELSRSRDAMVIDLDLDNYRSYYPQQLISDERAIAQYYNNRAMEIYADTEDAELSFYYLQAALNLDEQQSFLWNNLAAVYRRAGHSDLAEALYVRALENNHEDLTAIFNLSQVYRETDRTAQAEQLQNLVREYQYRNPYYQYWLARQLYGEQDYRTAARHIARAIRAEPQEPQFHLLSEDINQALHMPPS